MSDTVKSVSKIFIRGSIEDVWHEITKVGEPCGCFFNMTFDTTGMKPGAQLRMRSASGKYTGCIGEVLEFDPPHRFSHTFKFTQYDDPPCKVTYLLEEIEGGVQFSLISENIPAGTKTAKQMTRGNQFITKTLKAIVENGRPSLGTRILYRVFGLLEPLTPNRCRSEHWPL